MAVSKVTLNNETLMDVTDATATATEVFDTYTAYGADGLKITGEAIGGESETILPSGYTQLEYIRFSGSQYILTDYRPVQNDVIDTIILPQAATGAIFSCGTGDYQWILLNGQYYKYFATGNASTLNPTLANGKIYAITAGSTITVKTPGAQDVTALSSYENPIGGYLYIGKRAGAAAYFTGCVFVFSITNGKTIKANYIPCIRKADSKIGLYDVISNNFYPSASDTELEAGPIHKYSGGGSTNLPAPKEAD